jgi:uncharacterized protein (DUF58 family)
MGVLFRMPWLVVFAMAVLILLTIAQYWNRHALDNLTYKRQFRYTRGFAGESLEFNLQVENNKKLPINWLKTEDRWPYAVGPADAKTLTPTHLPEMGNLVNLYSLRQRQKTRREFPLLLQKRGLYNIGPVSLESGDPFGLFRTTQEEDLQQSITVFPDLVSFDFSAMSTEDPLGERKTLQRLFEDPAQPMGVREYLPDDEFRRIHWPATARTGELQVKVFPPVSSRVLMICLNAATTRQPWLGTLPNTFEQLLSISATIACDAMEKGYQVGLISNGSVAHSDHPFRVLPGRTSNHLAFLLQTLAAATDYITAPFEQFLLQSLGKIPLGSALVIVSACTTGLMIDSLVRMQRYRSHITLVALDEAPPPTLPGISVVHLPFAE